MFSHLEALEFLHELPGGMYSLPADDFVYSDSPQPTDSDSDVKNAVDSFFKEKDFGVEYQIDSIQGTHGWPIITVTGSLTSMLHYLSVIQLEPEYTNISHDDARKYIASFQAGRR